RRVQRSPRGVAGAGLDGGRIVTLPERQSQRGWQWGDDIALLVVALTAGVGASRLTSDPHQRGVWLPIALCVIAGHVATALVGRRFRRPAWAPVAGIVAVMLVAVWALVP